MAESNFWEKFFYGRKYGKYAGNCRFCKFSLDFFHIFRCFFHTLVISLFRLFVRSFVRSFVRARSYFHYQVGPISMWLVLLHFSFLLSNVFLFVCLILLHSRISLQGAQNHISIWILSKVTYLICLKDRLFWDTL